MTTHLNYLRVLPGGLCFAHGPYTTQQCPKWPACATDPKDPDWIAEAERLTEQRKTENPIYQAGYAAGQAARRSWKPGDGDTVCQSCGRANPVWFADSDVWNCVIPEVTAVLCPICFIERADKVIRNTGWKLVPDLVD